MKSKIALVTGGNRGIGLEICRQLMKLDFHVILTCRDQTKGKSTLAQFKKEGGNIEYMQLDVSNKENIQTVKDSVVAKYGRLDVLVNNAGINYDKWHNTLDADLTECRKTMEVNMFGPWMMSQAFMPLMLKNNYGRIVNVSSGSGSLSDTFPGTPGYSISKAALNMLTVKLAERSEDKNVLINSVCPGWVKTDMGGPEAPGTPSEGAQSAIWAATIPDGGPNGGFFRHGDVVNW